jgi:hypothetical protein
MRTFMLCLAFVVGLALAAPASAQGFPPGPWRGTWTGGTPGYEYQAELDFTMDLQGRVQGQFRWMLVQSPRHEDQAKIGLRGVEHVEGAFDAQTGALTLRGTRTDDPHGVIGADTYRLVVSPNGQYITGLTEDHGSWQGRIELTRFGPS